MAYVDPERLTLELLTMRLSRLLALTLVASLSSACSPSITAAGGEGEGDSSPSGIWAGNVVAQAAASGVELMNHTTAPVGYAAFERTTAAVVLWGPCTRGSSCPSVAPGERRTVRYEDISGADRGREILVYWWHLVPGKDGALRADSIRTILVRR